MPTEVPINLEATLSKNMIEIKVFDYGSGFDLSEKLSTLDDVDINALGGRGLDLISQMVDVFTYNKTPDGRNCMLISKSYISVD
jgi:serine/threonine-protein kinase RsbW